MYTQEMLDHNYIDTSNKYYRAYAEYKFNKLKSNDPNSICTKLDNPNLTTKDLYHIINKVSKYNNTVYYMELSVVKDKFITVDDEKMDINILSPNTIEDVIVALKEDISDIILKCILELNMKTFRSDRAIKNGILDKALETCSGRYGSILNDLSSTDAYSVIVGNILRVDCPESTYIHDLRPEKITKHNAYFILDSYRDSEIRFSRLLLKLEESDAVKSIDYNTRKYKFNKGYSVKTITDCAFRLLSRYKDFTKLDVEAIRYALLVAKEDFKDVKGVPADVGELLDYFFINVQNKHQVYVLAGVYDGSLVNNHYFNFTTDDENPTVSDLKKDLKKLPFPTIVDNIINYTCKGI